MNDILYAMMIFFGIPTKLFEYKVEIYNSKTPVFPTKKNQSKNCVKSTITPQFI